jgi:hypothetical protein
MVCVVLLFFPHQVLAEKSAERFTLVLNGAAVKDNQTG